MGANVVIEVPASLRKIVQQSGGVLWSGESADYFCSLLHLLYWLKVTPQNVTGAPYLKVDKSRLTYWTAVLGSTSRKRVGIA